MHTQKFNVIYIEKKNGGEKINEMSEPEVSLDENSISSDVEKEILKDLGDKIKCLKPYQFEPEREPITSVADTDESDAECSEESDEECHSHSAIKECVGNITWYKCIKCNVEKREIDCLCCLEVTALNEKFDKFSVKCVTEAEEFEILCINKTSAWECTNWTS